MLNAAQTGARLGLSARKVYDEVIKLGARAGESALQAARQAQKSLPR